MSERLNRLIAAFDDDCRKTMFKHEECKTLRELLFHYQMTTDPCELQAENARLRTGLEKLTDTNTYGVAASGIAYQLLEGGDE